MNKVSILAYFSISILFFSCSDNEVPGGNFNYKDYPVKLVTTILYNYSDGTNGAASVYYYDGMKLDSLQHINTLDNSTEDIITYETIKFIYEGDAVVSALKYLRMVEMGEIDILSDTTVLIGEYKYEYQDNVLSYFSEEIFEFYTIVGSRDEYSVEFIEEQRGDSLFLSKMVTNLDQGNDIIRTEFYFDREGNPYKIVEGNLKVFLTYWKAVNPFIHITGFSNIKQAPEMQLLYDSKSLTLFANRVVNQYQPTGNEELLFYEVNIDEDKYPKIITGNQHGGITIDLNY